MRSIILLCFALAATAFGQAPGDYLFPRWPSSPGPLTPTWVTPQAGKVLGFNEDGLLVPVAGSADWAAITSKPTTLAGYGITDSITASLASTTFAPISHTQPWSTITNTPTTAAGYGITDALSLSLGDERYSQLGHTHAFADLTSKPTTLSGYGITDAQPLDSDLTSIAALTTTSYGRALLALADAAALRTAGGLVIGTDVQAYNAALTTFGSNGSAFYLSRSNHTGTQPWSTIASTPTTLAGYGITDAAALSHTHAFADLTSKPTTLSGYGITDAQPLDSDLTSIAALTTTSYGRALLALADAAALRTAGGLIIGTDVQAYNAALTTFGSNGSAYYLSRSNHTGTQPWSTIASTPTTLAGYGITDAAALSHTHAFADLTSKPTTLSGYGITDAQPLDSDLTSIAALTTTTFGRDLLALADAAALRTAGGLVIGTDVQAYNAALTSFGSNGSAYYLSRANHTGTQPWSTIASTPTTLAGYGITDAAALTHTHAFADLTSKPTTLAGYGITDAAALSHTHAFADLTSKPTTLSGYGITDAQPLDSDLTSIAALTTTSFGRGLLAVADAAALRTAGGLVIGTDVQAYNAALTTFGSNGSAYYLSRSNHAGTQPWSTLTSTPTTLAGYGITDAQALDSDLTSIAALTTASYGRSLLTLASASAGRTSLGLDIGTDVQAYNSNLRLGSSELFMYENVANGGGIYTYGGAYTGSTGGRVKTNGGGAIGVTGGVVETYGATNSGGNITTYDGGGSINTRGTGSIELGATGTRTTLQGNAGSDFTLKLPSSVGVTGQELVASVSGSTNTSAWQTTHAEAVLTSNFTTTSNSSSDTNLSFAIAANEVWVVDVQLTTQCSSTGGVKFRVSAPTSATVEGWVFTSTSAITTDSRQRITAINTLTGTAAHTVGSTPGPDMIRFTVTNSTNAGTVAIGLASVTNGQTTTVFAGSWLRARRIQ